jgi:hypothetical protein
MSAACRNEFAATNHELEVHIDWQGETRLVGRLHAAERGASVSFEYDAGWLQREDSFAIDPTSLPLQRGAHHGTTLFGRYRIADQTVGVAS